MLEKTRSSGFLTERLFNSDIGSAESRAAARRLVEQLTNEPNLLLIFVNPRPRGLLDESIGPVEFNSKTAIIDGREEKLMRFENESQEKFEQRVSDNLPAVGLPGLAYLFPDDLPPAA